MYCTVCHSSRRGLTSPTAKTTGSQPGLPAENQGGNFAETGVQYPPYTPGGSLHELQAQDQATPSSYVDLGQPHTSPYYSKSVNTDSNCFGLHAAVV